MKKSFIASMVICLLLMCGCGNDKESDFQIAKGDYAAQYQLDLEKNIKEKKIVSETRFGDRQKIQETRGCISSGVITITSNYSTDYIDKRGFNTNIMQSFSNDVLNIIKITKKYNPVGRDGLSIHVTPLTGKEVAFFSIKNEDIKGFKEGKDYREIFKIIDIYRFFIKGEKIFGVQRDVMDGGIKFYGLTGSLVLKLPKEWNRKFYVEATRTRAEAWDGEKENTNEPLNAMKYSFYHIDSAIAGKGGKLFDLYFSHDDALTTTATFVGELVVPRFNTYNVGYKLPKDEQFSNETKSEYMKLYGNVKVILENFIQVESGYGQDKLKPIWNKGFRRQRF